MFSTVRVNSQIFILTKGQTPVLEVGNVCEEPKLKPAPYQTSQMPNPYQFPQPQVVELVVQTPNGRRTFPGIPADKTAHDDSVGGVPIFVTEDKSLMLNELNVLKAKSENIVKSYEHNKELIGIYDGMIGALNPEAAEKKQYEARISSLESQLQQTLDMMREMMSRNEKPDGGSKSSKNKE